MSATTLAEPRLRLVRPPARTVRVPELDPAQRVVVEHAGGPLLVLAGPGTGKTTAVVEAVVARIDAGVDPERVLVLTFGRRAAAELRDRVTARLGRTVREPVARTFHSYAFGVLRREAAQRGEPPPRLLAGPEQDVVVRDLIRGGLARGDGDWPPGLAAALPTRGFAQELRDLLMRCAERSVPPVELDRLGRAHARADWRAAARFAQEYADVTALASAVAYDPAELIGAAAALLEDPRSELGSREPAAYDWVFVDEYQDTDPAQERLLQLLVPPGGNLVVVGDPDQSIYGFRGADARGITRFRESFRTAAGDPAPEVALVTCRRSAPAVVAAGAAVATSMRGRPRRAPLAPLPGRAPGRVDVLVAASASQEAAVVAGALRRAHLVDGVPWSAMAVLVRSTRGRLAVLRRALSAAGVPVAVPGDDIPLVDQPGVQPLLALVRASPPPPADGGPPPLLDEELAVELVTGPLGGVDAVGLRRLRRELRRLALAAARPGAPVDAAAALIAAAPVAAALEQPLDLTTLPPHLRRPVERVAELLATVRAAVAAPGASAESVLWAAWSASGLSARWQVAALGSGPRAAAAERDLDAVLALFDAAARFVDRLPSAKPWLFLEHLADQLIPGDVALAPATAAGSGDAVRVLTAHAAKGLEWEFVVVAGLQEAVWPDLRSRGSLLGSEVLLDVLATGSPVAGSDLPRLLEEERRLFYVALTRARERLLLTAVQTRDDDEAPSRFLDLVPLPADDAAPVLAFGVDGLADPEDDTDLGSLRRGLALPALLVRLREVRVDARQPAPTRSRARDLLRELAEVSRSLDIASLVAELRSVVTDEAADPRLAAGAATELARLAAAGVVAADPDHWYAALPLSDDGPLREDGGTVAVSPSRIATFGECELRWLLESVGGTDPDSSSQTIGNVVHALAADSEHPDLRTREALLAELERRWARVDLGSPWFTVAGRERAALMVRRFLDWRERAARELVATEVPFAVEVPVLLERPDGGSVSARLAGRVDRLERDALGRPVVIDLKTGSSKPTPGDLETMPQLGAYQLAAEHGAFGPAGEPATSGGAALVHLGKGASSSAQKPALEQAQAPLADADDPSWAADLLAVTTRGMAGAAFLARENEHCRMCPVRGCCPLQAEGLGQ